MLHTCATPNEKTEHLSMPFGRIVDSVGPRIGRSLAVLRRAIAAGHGAGFSESFLRRRLAGGIDATTDASLETIRRRAPGWSTAQARRRLPILSSRYVAEADHVRLYSISALRVIRFGSRGAKASGPRTALGG